MASDQQSPHGPGISDATGGAESTRQTPYGISNLPTDDPLEHAGELAEGRSDQGMTSGSLGEEPASMLTEGFAREEVDRAPADGRPYVLTTSDKLADGSGDALDGFLGRPIGQDR